MMAGKRFPLGINISWALGLLAVSLIGINILRAEGDDDASFRNRSQSPTSQSPQSQSTLRQGPSTAPPRRRPTSTVTEDEDPREQRPRDPAVLEVQRLTPELEAVLDSWEEKTSQIAKLKGNFVKTSYDNVFEVQKLARGEFMYEAPDKGYYTFQGYNPKNIKAKHNDRGVPFKLEADIDEKWYCTGEEIYQLNVTDRTYDRVDIPKENRGKNIIDGPLPFLFGMKKDQAVRRYTLELVNADQRQIRLKVKPKLQHDLMNYSEAEIILDARTYLPYAVKLLDPPGTKTTVHMFEGVTTSVFKWTIRDPFRPNLLGYKPVIRKDAITGEDPETIRRSPIGKAPEGPSRSFLPRPRTAQQRESGM